MSIELNRQIVRTENLMSARVDNEIVILNMSKNNYIGLNEIALRIWDLLEAPRRVDEICNKLVREFEAETEQIESDLLPFLEELKQEGLIKIVD